MRALQIVPGWTKKTLERTNTKPIGCTKQNSSLGNRIVVDFSPQKQRAVSSGRYTHMFMFMPQSNTLGKYKLKSKSNEKQVHSMTNQA